ncbi:ribonucleotide-diphosphate reductase subunit alpha, partial [Candidatus Pacearchaeota archaeon]|nr:ribonucleotide-diphosphate reductase subunit alpha [Candidatus Pacearchaeota archaeon]
FSQSPIEKIVKSNRKIGLGLMGWANLLTRLGVSYGSEKSFELAEKVMGFINKESKKASVKLAKKRGVFPNWEGSIYDSQSPYFKGEELKLRNATTTTIAPTGTLSTLVGVEGGIEPIYGITFIKNAVYDQEGNAQVSFSDPSKYFLEIARKEGFYSDNLMEKIAKNKGSIQKISAPENVSQEKWSEIQRIFVTAHDLKIEGHIKMQASFQKYTDNAVSKTINMPAETPIEWVEKSFFLAHEYNLKGITIYKDGSLENQVRTTKKEEALDIKNGDRPNVIGTTIKQPTPYGPGFVTLNVFEENNSIPFESFINVGKGGKDISAISEGYGRLVSLCFKYGAPIKEIISQLKGIGGETQTGFGKNKVRSLPDALGQGIEEGYKKLNNEKKIVKQEKNNSGNLCPDCGALLIFSEGCEKCRECGFSKC